MSKSGSTQGFSSMYDDAADTELEGPTRYYGTPHNNILLLSFAVRGIGREFSGLVAGACKAAGEIIKLMRSLPARKPRKGKGERARQLRKWGRQ